MPLEDPVLLVPRHLWYDTPGKRERPADAPGLGGEELVTLLEALDPVMLLLNLAGWETPRIVLQRRADSEEVIEIGLPKMNVSQGTWSTDVGGMPPSLPGRARIAIGCQELSVGAPGGTAIAFDSGFLLEGRDGWRFMELYPEISDDIALFLRNVFAAAEECRRRLIPRIAARWQNPGERVNEANVGLLGIYYSSLWEVLPEARDPLEKERRQLIQTFGARMWSVLCDADIQEFLGQETLPAVSWLPELDAGDEGPLPPSIIPMGLTQEELREARGSSTKRQRRHSRQDVHSLHKRVLAWGFRSWLRNAGSDDAVRLDSGEVTLVLWPWLKRPMPFRVADIRQKTYTRVLLSAHAHGAMDVLGRLVRPSRQQIDAIIAKQALTSDDISTLCRWIVQGVSSYHESWAACARLELAYGTAAAKDLRVEIRHALVVGLTFAPPDSMYLPVEAPPPGPLEPAPAPSPPGPGIFASSWIELLKRVLAATPESGAALELITWMNELQQSTTFSPTQYPSNLATALLELFDDGHDRGLRGLSALYAARIWTILSPPSDPAIAFDEHVYGRLCAACRRAGSEFSQVGMLRAYLRVLLYALGTPRLHQVDPDRFFGEVWSSLLNRSTAAGDRLFDAQSGPLYEYYYCVCGLVHFSASDTSEEWRGRLHIQALMDKMRALESTPAVIELMETAWSDVLDQRLGEGAREALTAEQVEFVRSNRYVAYLLALDPDERVRQLLFEIKRLSVIARDDAQESFDYCIGMLILRSDDLIDTVENAEELSEYIGEALKLLGYGGDVRDLSKVLADSREAGVALAEQWSELHDTRWSAFAQGKAMQRATALIVTLNLVISYTKLKPTGSLENFSYPDYSAWAEWLMSAAFFPYAIPGSMTAAIPSLQGRGQFIQKFGGLARQGLTKLESFRKATDAVGNFGKGLFAVVGLIVALQGAWEAWNRGETLVTVLRSIEAAAQAGTIVVAAYTAAGITGAGGLALGPAGIPLWSLSVVCMLVGVGVSLSLLATGIYRTSRMESVLVELNILFPEVMAVYAQVDASGVVFKIYVQPGQYVSSGDEVAQLLSHPDVHLEEPGEPEPMSGPHETPVLSRVSVYDPTKVMRIHMGGQPMRVWAEFGMKVHSFIAETEYFKPPASVLLGEPRFTYVVTAARGGEILEVSRRLGDLVAPDEVLVRISATSGDQETLTAGSKVKGYVVGLFVRVGMTVKQDDPIAWIASEEYITVSGRKYRGQ
ncbi:MAG TPA: hypothetical protein PKW35_00430 [Nannocystaceae bacterium]|nr:hypothetical protein [Nannocystaceae bacterium]